MAIGRRRFLALGAAGAAGLAVPLAGPATAQAAPATAPFASATWQALVGQVVTATAPDGRTLRLKVRGVAVDAATPTGQSFHVSLRAASGTVTDGVHALTATGLGRKVPVFVQGAGGADARVVVNRTQA